MADGKILLIRMNHSYAGFFSYVTFALNQLRYCESHGLLPVVYFGAQSGDGKNAFYDPRHGDNTWDYFFEPVAGLTYRDVSARVADPWDPLNADDVVQLDPGFLWYLHAYDPDGIYNYPYGIFKSLPRDCLDGWYARQRVRARYFLAKYVRPKRHVLAKVDEFWKTHLDGHDVIGVHMRGSDKGAADASPALSRIVEPEEYFPFIDGFLDEARSGRILLATEQSQFVARARARYGHLVVARDVIRTDTFGPTSNPFQDGAGSGYAKGEEVLIDCLLLARSRRLLRCTSAVGEYAVYFNEGLESVNLNHLEQEHASPPIRQPPAVSTPARCLPAVRDFFGPGRLFEGAILINLDSRPDRLADAMEELKRHDLDTCVLRMSAVKHENGQYGCSLSHLEAVRYARWKGWRSLLILEDDITLTDAFADAAPPPLAELAAMEWGIFQFGAMIDATSLELVSPHLFRFRTGHAAHAVALHARTYDYLIGDYVCELWRGNWNLPVHVPFDEYLNNHLSRIFPAYGSRTLLISQRSGFSDAWHVEVDYRSLIEEQYERLQSR
jgi:hypothetical protein